MGGMCLAVSYQRCCGTQMAAMLSSLFTSPASQTYPVSPYPKLHPPNLLLFAIQLEKLLRR